MNLNHSLLLFCLIPFGTSAAACRAPVLSHAERPVIYLDDFADPAFAGLADRVSAVTQRYFDQRSSTLLPREPLRLPPVDANELWEILDSQGLVVGKTGFASVDRLQTDRKKGRVRNELNALLFVVMHYYRHRQQVAAENLYSHLLILNAPIVSVAYRDVYHAPMRTHDKHEILQDCFLMLTLCINRFEYTRPGANLYAFAYSSVRGRLLNEMTRRRLRPAGLVVSPSAELPTRSSSKALLKVPSGDAEPAGESDEYDPTVNAFLQRLPPHERRAIEASLKHGRSVEAAAADQGILPKRQEMRLNRARELMRMMVLSGEVRWED